MKKIVFFGGKGGVGKTTCASAYALSKVRDKKKVLLVSTDPAHSTTDIFNMVTGGSEDRINQYLSLIEIDANIESKRYLEGILESSKGIVSPVILDEIRNQIEMTRISPGTHEAALFERMGEIILTSSEYDYIIFDTAPTGHTLRLIKLPYQLRNWTDKLLEKRRKIMRLKEMKTFKKGLMEEDKVIKILEKRRRRFDKLGRIFEDSSKCIFNLVLNPEYLALQETARAMTELKESGIVVENLILNKCLPLDIDRNFWKIKLEEQSGIIDILEGTREDTNLIKLYLNPNLSTWMCVEKISTEYK